MCLFHYHRWGIADEKRFQYCSICGIAREVPLPEPQPCVHDWEQQHASEINAFGMVKGYLYLLRCKKCGDLKNHRTHV